MTKNPEEFTPNDWNQLLIACNDRLANFPPGDPQRLDLLMGIQSIKSEGLGENFGHARYFLENPVTGQFDKLYKKLNELGISLDE